MGHHLRYNTDTEINQAPLQVFYPGHGYMKQHLSQEFYAYGQGMQQVPVMNSAQYYMPVASPQGGGVPKASSPYMLGFSPVS